MAAAQDSLFPASASGGGPSDPPQPRWDREGVIRAGHDLEALDLKVVDGWWTLKRPYGEGRIVVPPLGMRAECGYCLDGLALEEPTPDPCPVCDRYTEDLPTGRRSIGGWKTMIASTTGRRVADLGSIPRGLRPTDCEVCYDGLLSMPWSGLDPAKQPPDMHFDLTGDPCSYGYVPCSHGFPPSEHGCV